ncbi:unnamed protein product [Sphagnum balticum]
MASLFSAWFAARSVPADDGTAVEGVLQRVVGEVDRIVCRNFSAHMPPNILVLMRYVMSDWMTKRMNRVNVDYRPGTLVSVNGVLKMVGPQIGGRIYFKSSEFIGPNLYIFELWKDEKSYLLKKLKIRRVYDTARPSPSAKYDPEIQEFAQMITMPSGFYMCECIIRTDGSYLNDLTLKRL